MALTEQQQRELEIARARIASGQGTPTDQANVQYAEQGSQQQPQTYTDFINQAFESPQLQEAENRLTELTEKAPTFYEDTLSGLKTKDPLLQQLQQQRAGFVSDLYAKPFEAREQYSDIFDPNKREALVSRAIGNVMGQLSGTGSMIENRGGTLEQQAQTALKVFETQFGAAQNQYSELRDMLKSIAEKNYGELQSQIKRQQDLEDYASKQAIQFEYDRALKGVSGGGSGGQDTSEGTYTTTTGDVVRYKLDENTGEVTEYVIGNKGIDLTEGEREQQVSFDDYADRLETGDITLDDIEKLNEDGKIDLAVYRSIKNAIESDEILPARRKSWYESDWVGKIPFVK